MRRLGHHRLHGKAGGGVGTKGMVAKLSIGVIVLLICTLSLLFSFNIGGNPEPSRPSKINVEELWESADSGGWRPSSAPRSDWPPPTKETNGYLRVRCNGGLNQQRSAICNAVLAARIMNATLVLPELDANSFWHDASGFQGIYDVEHFIETLKYDVKIVGKIPDVHKNGKTKKIKAFQIRPPRDAPIDWYLTTALKAMKEHSAIYLTPFSHRLAEEIDNPEYQRLRCRVNYHALRFKPHIMKLSESIVDKLRSQGHFMSIHLRFEMDMLAFAGCFDIFNPEEQKILRKYRKENFAEKRLIYNERRAIGKCPLTPEEVGLILRAMRFDNSTRIYLAAGELFGGERFMSPFRTLFPRLDNHSSVDPSEELSANSQGLIGSAVDYMVCLLSDIFMPTYDGPSNFANNLLGHRLYYGFRTTIRPDRKALAPVFIAREKGKTAGFEEAVRRVMLKTNFGGPHKRVSPESFYTNSWPECFCQMNERLKLNLSSTRVPDKSSGLVKREKIACFDKECSKVADHIYVGGDAVAKDKEILKSNRITHILNCVGFICPEYFKSDFCYRSLWLRDSPSEDITSILYDVFDYFEDVREQKGRIFVHCCQGVSRSTSLVIAYLMWREGQSFDDAFHYVKSARGIADPNMGFACQLLQCQKRVHAFPLSPTSLLRMYKMSPHSPYDPLHLVPKLLNDPRPSSLDSRGAFILQLPSAIYIWVGRLCEGIMERDAKAAVCQIARYEKVEAPITVVREGEEPGYYWDAFASILPVIADGSTGKTTQTGERRVEAYNLDFEIFKKAIEGGFVPTLASSNNEHETHLPARENSWSSLKCKFASRFERGFRYVSKTPLSRVYSDSMMIVHALGSPSSSTTTASSDSVCAANPSNSRKSFPPPLILPKFASLSLLPSQTSTEPGPSRKASPSLAERRGGLKGSLKLPGLADDSSDIVFNLEGVRKDDPSPLSDGESERIVDSDLPQKEMDESGSGQALACRWPSMEMITEVSRGYLDSESVIALVLPSGDDDVGGTSSRILYIWIGKSFAVDNNCYLLDSNKAVDSVENLDWVQIGEAILSKMDLPKDTPVKIVREAEDQTEFLALLSAL